MIPYVHRTSLWPKKVGGHYNLDIVFSAPAKLSQCAAVQKRVDATPCAVRKLSHLACEKYVECCENVVCKIPMTCSNAYIGQTRCCLNIRLMEHKNSLSNDCSHNLADYYREYVGLGKRKRCKPTFENTTVLFTHHNQLMRELKEAYHIAKSIDICISTAFVTLTHNEFAFLDDT